VDESIQGEVMVTWPGFDVDDPATGLLLRDIGLSIRLEPKTGPRSADELRNLLDDSVAVIASTDPFDAQTFESHKRLKVIARTGVGVDSIDMAAATRAGVAVVTTPGANEETVADHTLALMLAVTRRVVEQDRAIRDHRWERTGEFLPRDLFESTVGLIGSGNIGRAVIRRLLAFRSNILVADPGLSVAPEGAKLVDLDTLMSRSDVVSLHVPLLDQTRGLIGADQLALMRPSAVLVNCSRGHIVDEEALGHALDTGRLAGAALDVFASEPPFDSDLISVPNLILTPHVGGLSDRSVAAMTQRASRAVIETLSGGRPADTVNPEVF